MDSLQTKIKEVIDSSMIYTPEQVKELNKDLDSTTQQNEYMTALGYQDALLDVHSSIPKIVEIVREEEKQRIRNKIGFMRQWLNEDRIDDVNKLVDSEDLLKWLE